MILDRPLASEEEHAAALAETRHLWGAEEGTHEGNRLSLLLVLVAAYEDEHHAIEPPNPIDAIVACMNERGMSRAELGVMLGGASSGRVSEILNRRRPLTIDMVRRLAAGLGLSEHCLLQDYELVRSRQYA